MIVSPRMSAVSFRKVTYHYNMQITPTLSSEFAVAQMVRLRCCRVIAQVQVSKKFSGMIEKLNFREVENGAHGAQSNVVEGVCFTEAVLTG